jgi:hypothetical protein
MGVADSLKTGFGKIMSRAGRPVLIRYYSQVVGSVWDDETTLTQSAGSWVSGIVFPIQAATGTTENLLVEQGKLNSEDLRLFVEGSVAWTGDDTAQLKVQIGSPTGDQWAPIPLGYITQQAEGQSIFSKAYIRRIPIGSLIGE